MYKKQQKKVSKLIHIKASYSFKTKKLQIILDKLIKARLIWRKQIHLIYSNKVEQKTLDVTAA